MAPGHTADTRRKNRLASWRRSRKRCGGQLSFRASGYTRWAAKGGRAWRRGSGEPLGTVRDVSPIPLPIRYGVPNLGGPLLTGGGLVFIGAALDHYLRAFDVETGEEIWKARLPAGGQATPMSYRMRDGGRQYVIISATGYDRANVPAGDAVVAFALE